jgi:hypothetical protein
MRHLHRTSRRLDADEKRAKLIMFWPSTGLFKHLVAMIQLYSGCAAGCASFALLSNTRKTGAVSSAPPQGLASFFPPWRRNRALCASIATRAQLSDVQWMRAKKMRILKVDT